MLVLEPKLALLDETDSGLDIDALKVVANGVNSLRAAERAIVLVTHYQRLLDYVVPDFVHVLARGRIVRSGDRTLALELERRGYDWISEQARLKRVMTRATATLRSDTRSHPARLSRRRRASCRRAPCRAARAARAPQRAGASSAGRSARDEQWRYANLRAFERVRSFRPDAAARAAQRRHARCRELPPPLPGFERLVFVDGVRVAAAHRAARPRRCRDRGRATGRPSSASDCCATCSPAMPRALQMRGDGRDRSAVRDQRRAPRAPRLSAPAAAARAGQRAASWSSATWAPPARRPWCAPTSHRARAAARS